MGINDVKKFTDFCFNKNQSGYISGDQFNLLAPIAQISVINDRLGNVKKYQPHDPVPSYGLGISQKGLEELRILHAVADNTTAGSDAFVYSTDCLYIHTIVDVANQKIITPVQHDEFKILSQSLIKPPVTGRAIYSVFGLNIFVSPTPAAIRTFYIRRPLTPKWNFTTANDREVYNATGSQDFELAETVHYEVCAKILQMVGLNLSLPEVVQYAAAVEAQGA